MEKLTEDIFSIKLSRFLMDHTEMFDDLVEDLKRPEYVQKKVQLPLYSIYKQEQNLIWRLALTVLAIHSSYEWRIFKYIPPDIIKVINEFKEKFEGLAKNRQDFLNRYFNFNELRGRKKVDADIDFLLFLFYFDCLKYGTKIIQTLGIINKRKKLSRSKKINLMILEVQKILKNLTAKGILKKADLIDLSSKIVAGQEHKKRMSSANSVAIQILLNIKGFMVGIENYNSFTRSIVYGKSYKVSAENKRVKRKYIDLDSYEIDEYDIRKRLFRLFRITKNMNYLDLYKYFSL